jgi:preprotein translocase SecE subunit
MGFFVSCIAELRRVQWPDRDTLIQASAVTLVFITVAAAYLGVLDASFNWLVQRIL